MTLSRRLLWFMVMVGCLGVSWGGTAYAGTGVTVAWDGTYGTGTLFDTAYDVQPAPDGGFIAVGVQDYRILVVKTDASGQEQWSRTLNYNNYNEGAYSVEATQDGGYVVIGSLYLTSALEFRPWLVKLDSTGTTVWSTEAGVSLTTPVDSAIIRGIERPDGSFVVVGGNNSFTDIQAPWVLLVSASGEGMGFTEYPEPFPGYGSGTYISKIIATADGGFALIGGTGPIPGKALLWKFDANATPEWIKTYEADFFRAAFGGTTLPGGGYILTGCDLPNCNRTVVLKTEADGDTVWARTYDPQSGNTQGNDIFPTEEGYLLAQIGYSAAGSTTYRSELITLDANGGILAGTPLRPNELSTYLYTLRPVIEGDTIGFIGAGNNRTSASSGTTELYLVRGTVEGTTTPNQPPTAQPDSYSTNEDQGFVIEAPGLLANDSDPENDPITAYLVQPAPNGAVAIFADGRFQYTPNEGFVGTDIFTYRVRDQFNFSDPVNVTVTVNEAINHVPVALDDSYRTDEDMPLVIPASGVLDNDRDADGDTLTATLVNNTSNGTLAFNSDGSFLYTPAPGYLGNDSFTYTISDGVNTSAAATVVIEVVPPNTFTIAWQANFGGDGYDIAYDITPTGDGGFVTVGVRNYNLYAVKTDGNGGLLWQQELSLSNLNEGAYSVEETNDGNYIIIGSTTVAGSSDYRPWLIKLATDGTPIWSTENGLTQTTDVNSAIIRGVERADGTFVVVGGQNTLTDVQQPWRLVVSASGEALDFDLYENPVQGFGAGTYINDLFVTADGGFAIAGFVGPAPGEAFLWKFDSAAAPQWFKGYRDDGIRAVHGGRELPAGGYILTGCNVANCNQTVVARADANGDVIWSQSYTPSGGYRYGTDIVPKADGTFLLAEIGFSAVGSTNYLSALVELDSTGARLTETPIEGGTAATYIQRLRPTSDGFVLAGYTRNGGTANDPDFFVARAIYEDGSPNATPVALSDSYYTPVNQPLTVSGAGVLANDVDTDNDPLTSVTYGTAAHGTVTLNGTGGFTYTPAPNFAGMDSFTYIATDGREMSRITTVQIMVTPDIPTAVTLSNWEVNAADGWFLSAFTGSLLLAAIGWLMVKRQV
jgi:hypothetical protein